MYYYGNQTTCGQYQNMYYPYSYGARSNYAIVLVLFILLVIVLGSRFSS